MYVARHMPRVKPEIRIQRCRAPIRPIVSLNIRLIIASTETRRIHNPILPLMIQDLTQPHMRIKHTHLNPILLLPELLCPSRQRRIIPSHLCSIGTRRARSHIPRPAVKRRKIDKEIRAVPELVELIHGLEQRPREVGVERREIHAVFRAVADIVDADPDCDETFLCAEGAGEDIVTVVFELGYLVHEGDGEVVVKGCAVPQAC